MKCNVLIIGAGPAGLAAALHLDRIGIENIVLVDRQSSGGGILNQCIHTGFGLDRYNEDLTGPEFATVLTNELEHSNVTVEWNSMVVSLTDGRVTTVSREKGEMVYEPNAILLSVGCRERTLYQIGTTGYRPAGVFMAGQAQALVNLLGLKIGKKVVIQGSGDVGLILARRLTIEGYAVDRVLEDRGTLAGLLRNKVQCLDDYGIPLYLNHRIIEIHGKDRVEGVTVEGPGGRERIPCDTAVFAVGLIPETDLLRTSDISTKDGLAAGSYHLNEKGNIFICGNARIIHETADDAAKDGEYAATKIAEFLNAEINEEHSVTPPKAGRKLKNESYTETFFQSLSEGDSIPCIVCPRGCLVNETSYSCQKGLDYYVMKKKGEQKQRFSSTFTSEEGKRKALVTKDPIPVQDQKGLGKKMESKELRERFIQEHKSNTAAIHI